MKTLLRLLALAVALSFTSPADSACISYYNGHCVWWQPELPPGARWCAAGERPDATSAMFWTYASNICMVMPIRFHKVGGTKIPNLNQYGWAGPSFGIEAMEFGARVYGWTYDDYSYNGNATFWQPRSASSTVAGYRISSFELSY